ncbi:MAG: hypothetical protein GY796_20710 [Chloroflexi bacterium]|nr:hypothetical protein [Chloroflexota bacterium]
MSAKNNPNTRVLLAVNTRELKTAFFLALGNEPDIKIVGMAVNTAELLTFTRALNPDAILLEWDLSGAPLTEIIPTILPTEATTKIFIISSPSSQQQCQAIVQSNNAIHVETSPENLITSLITNH